MTIESRRNIMSDFDNLTIMEQEEKIIEWLAHFYNVDKEVIETSYQDEVKAMFFIIDRTR